MKNRVIAKEDIGAATSKSEYISTNSDLCKFSFLVLNRELIRTIKENRKIAPGGGEMLLILPTKCSA
jgi:hypothetical protein